MGNRARLISVEEFEELQERHENERNNESCKTSEEKMEAFILRMDEIFNGLLKWMGIDKTIDEVVAESEAVPVVPIEENKAVPIVPREDNVFGAPYKADNALIGWRGINKTIQEVMVEEVKGDFALSTPVNKLDFYGYDSLGMKNHVYPNFSRDEDNYGREKSPCGNNFSAKFKNSVHNSAKDFDVVFSPVIKKDECLGTNCRKLDGNEFSHCHPMIVGVEETVKLDKGTHKNGEIIEHGCNWMPKNWRDSEFQNERYTYSLDSYGCELNMNNTERASENVVKEKKRKDNYISVKGLVSFYGLRHHEFLEEFDELKLSVVITKVLKGWAEVVTRFKGGGSVISINKEQASGVNSLASNYEKANWVTDPAEQASGEISGRDSKWTSKVFDKSFILQGAGKSMMQRGMKIVRFDLCPNHSLVEEFVQIISNNFSGCMNLNNFRIEDIYDSTRGILENHFGDFGDVLDDKLKLWWCYNKQKVIAIIMENFKNIGKSWVEQVTGFRGGTIFGRNYLAKLMLPAQQMEKLWGSLGSKTKIGHFSIEDLVLLFNIVSLLLS